MKANLLTLWTTLLCGTVALHAQEPQQGSMQPEGRFRQEAPQSSERNDGSGLQPLADSLARMEFLYAEPATLPGDWLDQGELDVESAVAAVAAQDRAARAGQATIRLHGRRSANVSRCSRCANGPGHRYSPYRACRTTW